MELARWLRSRRWVGAAAVAYAMSPTMVATGAVLPLAGTTRIEGQGGTYAEVKIITALRAFAVAPEQADATVAADGPGAVLAVALRRVDEMTGIAEPDTIHAIRLGPPGSPVRLSGAFEDDYDGTLHPGRYRLYLMSDGPVRATIRFPGAVGESLIRPSVPFPFSGGVLPQHQIADRVITFSGTGSLTDRGFMWMYARSVPVDYAAAQNFQFCSYEDGAETGLSGAAFGPGCAGGRSLGTFPFSGGDSRSVLATLFGNGRGTYALGGNYELAGNSGGLYAVAGWATYDESPPQLDLPPPQVPPARGGFRLELSRALVRDGRATLRLRCHGPGSCKGTASLGRNGTGLVTVEAPAEATRGVRLALSRHAVRRLRRRREIRAELVIRSRFGTHVDVARTSVRLRRA